jgi:hypothetical protein
VRGVSTRQLLNELRRLDVRVDYADHDDGDHGDYHRVDGQRRLLLDAPRGVVIGELKTRILDSKASLLELLEAERRTREQAGEQGLVIRWAEEPTGSLCVTPRPGNGTNGPPFIASLLW